jgi:hypothetical protein
MHQNHHAFIMREQAALFGKGPKTFAFHFIRNNAKKDALERGYRLDFFLKT